MDDRDTTDHRAASTRRARHLGLILLATAIIGAASFFAWVLSMIDV